MMKLLTTYMLSTVIVAGVLFVGCQRENTYTDNSNGVAIKPSNQQENIIKDDNQDNTTDETPKDDTIIDGNVVSDDTNKQDTQTNSQYITEEQAKIIAINHAGIDANDVKFSKVEFDFDDGVAEFEVDFYIGNIEYDYEVNAKTGEIISYGKDTNNNVTTKPTDSTYITEETAKQTAFDHAGITEQEVSYIKVEFDFDDGVAEYEVDFYVGKTEYEYEINAQTGNIISFDKDRN